MLSDRLLLSLLMLICSFALFAADVTRFRGPNSQGVFPETGLRKAWPEKGLPKIWQVEGIGLGWGAVTKVKDKIYVTGGGPNKKIDEQLTCLNLKGEVVWQTTTGKTWTKSYPYARATPTYVETDDGGRLYVSTGAGEIFCLRAADGTIVWNHDFAGTYEGRPGSWGYAESVVVSGNLVFATPVGNKASMVAYDLLTGKVAWEAKPVSGTCAYVTPVLHQGQIIQVTGEYLFGVEATTGRICWKYDFAKAFPETNRREISCLTPLVRGRRITATRGYNHGTVMLELTEDGNGVREIWKNNDLDTQHGGVVWLDDRLYGSTWITNSSGEWACVDAKTGATIYLQPWNRPGQPPPVDKDGKPVPLGKGSTIAADGMLYLWEEKRGTLGLAKPGGDQLEIVNYFTVNHGTGEYWAMPVISDQVLYMRRGNVLAAFDLTSER